MREQQQKLKVCENNHIQGIIGANRADRRRTNDPREDLGVVQEDDVGRSLGVGVEEGDVGRSLGVGVEEEDVGRSLGVDGGGLTTKEGRGNETARPLERPQLRWEECVKRDVRKAEEDDKWRAKTAAGAVQQYMN